MNPFDRPLPVAIRRHGEIVGIGLGTLNFPMGYYAGRMETTFLNGPAAIVLPIVMLSAAAGFLGCATADPRRAPEIAGVPLRVGVRAGIIASLISGAFAVLASTFHSFGLGSPSSVEMGASLLSAFFPSSPTARLILLAILAIPSSLFFSLIGALLAGAMKGDGTPAHHGLQRAAPMRTEQEPVFIAALLLTFIGYLSPLAILFKPEPKPPPVAVVIPSPRPPSPPPTTASAFESARASLAERERNRSSILAPGPSASTPPPPPSFSPEVEALRMQSILTAFLTEHHHKSSNGDVDGVVADYGDKVDHFNNGVVSRDFIRKDELEYHAPGSRVSETIIGQPKIEHLDSDTNKTYSAGYSINYHRLRPDGRWTKGISDIALIIEILNDHPRIVRQRAQNRNIERGP